MAKHFSCSPLFCIINAGFKSLFRVLIHDSLKSLHESKGICQRACESTVDVLGKLSDFSPVSFDSNVALTDLTISNDDSLVFVFESKDGSVMPGAEPGKYFRGEHN